MDDSFIKIFKFVFHKTTTFIKILKFVFHNTTHEWNQTKLRFRMQFFFVTLKKKEWTSVNQEIYIFTGCFFSHELLRLKTLTFNFIYYTCSAYMCIAILVSTYDQIIFKSRYLQIFFYHFASQILKNLYPKFRLRYAVHCLLGNKGRDLASGSTYIHYFIVRMCGGKFWMVENGSWYK